MKFLKKLILSEELQHIPKDIEIEILDYSTIPIFSRASKGVEDYMISDANINKVKSIQLLLNYSIEKVYAFINKDPNWKDPKKRIWVEAEKKIVLYPKTAFIYAEQIIYNQIQEDPTRWSEGEKKIAADKKYSYKYADEIIYKQILRDPNWRDQEKRRWAKGEKKIALDPSLAFNYAKNIILNQIKEDPTRWSEGEKTIAANKEYSYKYATEIIKQQIVNDPNWRDPEKRRWTEGEKIIALDPSLAFNYATNIIFDQIKEDPDRWREGEKTISLNESQEVFLYCLNVIKDQLIADPNRWPEGVKKLSRNVSYITKYAKMTNRPFPEGEQYLIKFGGTMGEYKNFIKKNWDSFTDDQKKKVNPVFLQN